MMQNSLKSWLSLLGPCIFALFLFFMLTSISVMIVPLKEDLKIGSVGIGVLASSFFYSYSSFQIIAGLLIDKYGIKRILLISILGVSISIIGFATAKDFYMALFFRIGMGLFFSSAFAAAFYAAAIWFSSSLFPFIAGLVEMSAMFGASLSAYTLAKPVKMFGWRYTMLGCAFVGILIFVYSAIFIKKDRIFKSTKDTPPSILKNLFFLIKNKNMWLCGIFAGICFSPILSIATLWGIPFFVEKYHSTLNVASSFTATIFIGVAIGNPLIGYFATKFNIYKPTMLAGIVINIVLISLLLYLPNFSNFSVTIISLFIGISSSIYVIPFIIVKEQFPIEICSTAMALTNVLCGFLGTIIFQPLLGKVITICRAMNIAEVNSYECALSLIPLALILGLILIFFIKSSIQERERA